MIKFIYQHDKEHPEVCITIKNQDITLDEVLDNFEIFLKASGYFFKGTLDFVEENE